MTGDVFRDRLTFPIQKSVFARQVSSTERFFPSSLFCCLCPCHCCRRTAASLVSWLSAQRILNGLVLPDPVPRCSWLRRSRIRSGMPRVCQLGCRARRHRQHVLCFTHVFDLSAQMTFDRRPPLILNHAQALFGQLYIGT